MNLQCEAIHPAVREVLDIDFLVRRGLALTPEQQPLFRRQTFLASQHKRMFSSSGYGRTAHETKLDGPDIGNGEPQDERPDHAQDELQVSVDYI